MIVVRKLAPWTEHEMRLAWVLPYWPPRQTGRVQLMNAKED